MFLLFAKQSQPFTVWHVDRRQRHGGSKHGEEACCLCVVLFLCLLLVVIDSRPVFCLFSEAQNVERAVQDTAAKWSKSQQNDEAFYHFAAVFCMTTSQGPGNTMRCGVTAFFTPLCCVAMFLAWLWLCCVALRRSLLVEANSAARQTGCNTIEDPAALSLQSWVAVVMLLALRLHCVEQQQQSFHTDKQWRRSTG